MSHLFLRVHTCISSTRSHDRKFFAKQFLNSGFNRALAGNLGGAAFCIGLALPAMELATVVGQVETHSVSFWSASAKVQ